VGLQWRHIKLDGDQPHVKLRCGVVRGKLGLPKSRYARREVPISSVLADASCNLWELLDDVEQLGAVVAVLAAELNELDRLGEQRSALGCAADTDPVTWAEFE
jgi:hypothetical protein